MLGPKVVDSRRQLYMMLCMKTTRITANESTHVTITVDGGRHNIHAEDSAWAYAQVDPNVPVAERNRRVVALCYGWGRRIAPEMKAR